MVVLDTCALIEACKHAPTFSTQTLKQMDAGAYLLSISFVEIACKIKLGKLEMNITSRELFNEYRKVENIRVIDIGVEEWLDSIDMDWHENKDPADRIIVSFAAKNKLPIVTTDKRIKHFYKKVIW